MGGGGKGKGGSGGSTQPSGTTTSTQNSSPWAGETPYLNSIVNTGDSAAGGYVPGLGTINSGNVKDTPGIFNAAGALYSNYTPQYFPGSTVSPFTAPQQTGLQQEANFGAQGGSSSVNQANNALTGIESGQMLGAGNPYFQGMANSIGQGLAPTINSQFETNGRDASGANQQSMSSALANAISPLAFQNYQSGLNNIVQGAALAPAVQSGQIQGMDTGVQAGSQMQQQNQAQLNDQINRFNFQQQLPYNQLATYDQMINGNFGGSSTLTQPFFGPSGGGGKGGSGGKSAGSISSEVAPLAMAFLM